MIIEANTEIEIYGEQNEWHTSYQCSDPEARSGGSSAPSAGAHTLLRINFAIGIGQILIDDSLIICYNLVFAYLALCVFAFAVFDNSKNNGENGLDNLFGLFKENRDNKRVAYSFIFIDTKDTIDSFINSVDFIVLGF